MRCIFGWSCVLALVVMGELSRPNRWVMGRRGTGGTRSGSGAEGIDVVPRGDRAASLADRKGKVGEQIAAPAARLGIWNRCSPGLTTITTPSSTGRNLVNCRGLSSDKRFVQPDRR